MSQAVVLSLSFCREALGQLTCSSSVGGRLQVESTAQLLSPLQTGYCHPRRPQANFCVEGCVSVCVHVCVDERACMHV